MTLVICIEIVFSAQFYLKKLGREYRTYQYRLIICEERDTAWIS